MIELNKWYLHLGKYPMMIFAVYNGHHIGEEFTKQDLWVVDFWSKLNLYPWDDRSTFIYNKQLTEVRRVAIHSIFLSGEDFL